jgi:ATP-dependent RNA helicase DeaD
MSETTERTPEGAEDHMLGPDGESVETTERPVNVLPEITLEDLPEALQKTAERMGWTRLMPVQAQAIPYLRAGRDLMVQSRTGSGKTGAFLLPLLEKLDPRKPACQAIIMVPTRELARQVMNEAVALGKGTGIRVTAVYGGVGYGPQLEDLKAGAHIVVGTPGRILDHLERRSLKLDAVKVLIFDEADRMLSVGFYPDMKAMEAYLPRKREGFMFSATFPPAVRSLAKQFLHDPEVLSLSSGLEHVAETAHIAYEAPSMEKDRILIRLIEMENPESAIVFTNTKAMANFVAVVLQRTGYDADQLSSDLSQIQREKVLARVYAKKLRFLVATDVAARGIDIQNLSHVFLYDFPEDPESYIHRTGRTGRAGASGVAISLVDNLEKLQLKAVIKQYHNIPVEMREAPTPEQVQVIVSERMTAILEQKLRGLDRLVKERMGRMMPLARKLSESDDELSLMAMLLDEHYQNTLHEVPESPADAPVPGEARRSEESSSGGGSGSGGGRRGRRDGGSGGGGGGGDRKGGGGRRRRR